MLCRRSSVQNSAGDPVYKALQEIQCTKLCRKSSVQSSAGDPVHDAMQEIQCTQLCRRSSRTITRRQLVSRVLQDAPEGNTSAWGIPQGKSFSSEMVRRISDLSNALHVEQVQNILLADETDPLQQEDLGEESDIASEDDVEECPDVSDTDQDGEREEDAQDIETYDFSGY
ncbi:uncharacterized protein LOC143786304 [Ranitomeya variabilis]|uniref:uncharacterized protein LOC143786304 n=1 Tax=Ranitomeya variabilis TaxID=490064 RepID=UPI004055EC9E